MLNFLSLNERIVQCNIDPDDLYGTLGAGAVVEGDVVVLGGIMEEASESRVLGTLRRQSERLEVRR